MVPTGFVADLVPLLGEGALEGSCLESAPSSGRRDLREDVLRMHRPCG